MSAPKPPINPYLVLLAAVVLPGFGHVLNGQIKRGITMQLFMIGLAFITWHFTPPTRDLVGQLSGGLFVYALSVMEAYRTARARWSVFNYTPPSPPAQAEPA